MAARHGDGPSGSRTRDPPMERLRAGPDRAFAAGRRLVGTRSGGPAPPTQTEMTGAAKLFLREIRIEHTLFALPFAYTGAVFAARGFPSWPAMVWITLAVFGARTAAMAANRYFDREIDARNPRTARRAVPSGKLAPATMVWATLAG